MCRALKVLCAAGDPDRLAELKQAVVSPHWELVGGAVDVDELAAQAGEWAPDIVVIRDLGQAAVAGVEKARPGARLVLVHPAPGAEDEAAGLHLVRKAILNGPAPAGPVRT
ncbi:MAG TPA: hypothetical protein DIT48_06210 [Actinobacteria bacterium]|jgi:hypothetical protein|nr:hypothetical protein [Actinomycetota bacterium]HCP61748.1 hypothetical protein [Actinomycetota bacterium]